MISPSIFERVVRIIEQGVNVSRTSHERKKRFATDLALVVLSIRTAYLVDAVSMDFDTLLINLRAKDPLFSDIVHLYDPASDQSFFVNVSLFLAQDYVEETTFIAASSPPRIVQPSERLCKTWRMLRETIDSSSTTFRLPDALSPCVTVPLAALLLEYPVAYVPEAGPGPMHVTLQVYECSITLPTGLAGIGVVKFSCPQGIVETVDCERLRDRYEARGVGMHVRKMTEGGSL
ncbi:hypothetical protein BDZ89DRAFT_696065 [Hymenopellis radicata]|nr:hypothetical protein BDZ89DRAFT_696065 [Hymenopellis radicata]